MKVGRFGLGELLAIVGGGAAIAAVFQPWYTFRLSDVASDAITRQSGLDPLSATIFQQGLNAGFAADQPTAWELFDRTDWVLLVIGALAVLTAVLSVAGLVDRPQPRMLALGAAAIIAVGYSIAIPPVDHAGVDVAIATWGWIALAASLLIALSATIPPPSPGPKPGPAPAHAAGSQTAPAMHSAMSSWADAGRAPGWYDDPEGSGMLRYWDGARWTWDTKKAEPGLPAAPSPPKTA